MNEEMQEACKLTCQRMQECINNFHNFKTEKEVKEFLEKDVKTAFDTIVASGAGAAEPHYAGTGEIKKGFCVIDFGIKYKGMCADLTRMVYVGKPSAEELNLYNELLMHHHQLLRKVKIGSKIRYIEKSFRKRLKEKEKMFIHALSHGVGKEIHEKMNKKLQPGDVITVEPGLYVKNKFGIRIEDVVLVGKRRKILTDSIGRELKIVNSE